MVKSHLGNRSKSVTINQSITTGHNNFYLFWNKWTLRIQVICWILTKFVDISLWGKWHHDMHACTQAKKKKNCYLSLLMSAQLPWMHCLQYSRFRINTLNCKTSLLIYIYPAMLSISFKPYWSRIMLASMLCATSTVNYDTNLQFRISKKASPYFWGEILEDRYGRITCGFCKEVYKLDVRGI